MTNVIRSLAIVLAAGAMGCMGGRGGYGSRAPSTAAPPTRPAPVAGHPCAMEVPGTQVAVADAPGGASITFTTSEPHVADLRARVHAMAEMHDAHHRAGAAPADHGGMHHGDMHGSMHGGMHGTGSGAGEHAGHGAMMPPSRAVAEDVPGGARVVVTPEEPADLERLRSTVRMHAQQMRESGRCMEHPAGG